MGDDDLGVEASTEISVLRVGESPVGPINRSASAPPTTTEVLRSISESYVIEAEIGVSDRLCVNGLGRSAHGHCSTVSNAGCENG